LIEQAEEEDEKRGVGGKLSFEGMVVTAVIVMVE